MHNIASAKFTPVKDLRPDISPCCEEIVNKLMTQSRAKRKTPTVSNRRAVIWTTTNAARSGMISISAAIAIWLPGG